MQKSRRPARSLEATRRALITDAAFDRRSAARFSLRARLRPYFHITLHARAQYVLLDLQNCRLGLAYFGVTALIP